MVAVSAAGGSIKRVAVIGAGARSAALAPKLVSDTEKLLRYGSGLTAIKELHRQDFEVTAFEARPRVGGAWIRTEAPSECSFSFDSHGRPFAQSKKEKSGPDDYPTVLEPTPMYQLRTNIPCDQMSYRSFPMKSKSGLFPRDDEILDYLEDFSKDIKDAVRFSTLVKRMYKLPLDSHSPDRRWHIELQDVSRPATSRKKTSTETFDAVCDCSGHYYRPFVPFTPGLWKYRKRLQHAKWYRGPEAYAGQDVLVVGNSSSGYDISREIALHFQVIGSANRVYASMRHPVEVGIDPSENPPWTSNLEAVPGIANTTEDEVILTNGRHLSVDTVIFATGYLYSFPYANTQDYPFSSFPLTKTPPLPETYVKPDIDAPRELPEGGARVHYLDEEYQTFFYPDPTLAFICLGKQVIPFPLAQSQAHAVGKYWAGSRFPLQPSTDTSESGSMHKYGFPKEFDLQDALLQAAGEGSPPEEGTEILPDGTFPAVASWRRENRPKCKTYRKETLGY